MQDALWLFLYYAELDCFFGEYPVKSDSRNQLEEAYAIFFCY